MSLLPPSASHARAIRSLQWLLFFALAACNSDPVRISSITIAPSTSTRVVGETVQLTATPVDAKGASIAKRAIAWSSSNTGSATVSGDGLVTAVSPGDVIITATSQGVSGTAAITVIRPPVSTVTVAPATNTKIVGETVQLSATTRDVSGATLTGRVVTWNSSNNAIATVSGTGLVTTVAAGTVTITATSEGRSGTAALTVTALPVTSLTISPATQSIVEASTAQLTATTKIASGATVTGRVITWTSSNLAAATVSNTGLVTGVAPGAATITATSEGVSGTAALTITLSPCNTSLAVTLSPGQTINGTLAATDCPFGDGTFLDVYRLTMTSSATVDIVLRSATFDAYLFIYGVNGTTLTKLAEDDDSGGGSDARLTGTLAAGTYFVLANSYDVNGFGPYTLSLVSPFTGINAARNSLVGSGTSAMTMERAGAGELRNVTLRGLVRRK